MALVATYSEITRAIARRLGYPLDSDQWSTSESQSVEDALRCGLRWFYFPTGEITHSWSFLRKLQTVTLASGETWYSLPIDFERLVSPVSLSGSKQPMATTSEPGIRLRVTNEGLSGKPAYCAVRPMQIAGDTRYEIGVYPTPGSSEGGQLLSFWYTFDPGMITSVQPEPLGGATHAETIVSACLAAAEVQMNPEAMAGDGGIHYQIFKANLAASVASDREMAGAL